MWVLIGANHFHVTRKRAFDPRLDSRSIMVPSNSSIPKSALSPRRLLAVATHLDLACW